MRPDGKLILLDLGAAKDLDIQGNDGSVQSSQMVAKHGFSPIEQYSKSGKVGPWTDIYAMAATIYYCCTGILPPPATDRTIDDTLACQPRLTQAQFDILADCMHMRPQDRPQSMDTLLQMLTHPQGEVKAEPPKVIPEVEPPKPVETKAAPPKPMETEPVAQKTQPINPEAQPTQPPRHDVKPERPLSKWLIPGVAAVVAVIALAISIGSGGKKSAPAPSVKVPTVQTAAEPAPTKAVPAVPMEVHTMAAADFVYEDDISATPFWGQSQYLRKDVNTLTFQSSLQNAPSSAWDVSEAGDRSVLAWMDNGNLYVAADGAIAPNPDAAWLFQDFVNMKTINFGNCFDTSDVTRMRGMFNGCSSLTDLDLSGFDTSSVTDMRMMFQNCASLTSLDLPGFDTSSVTDMRVMFQNCANLTSLDVSSFDTSNVIDMGAMFANCERLTGLDLSGFDTSHVTNMAAMFCICEDLTSLDLTGFDTSNVADMSNMFRSCTSLTNLNLSSFDASAVTKMDSMFYGCDNLPDIICPDSKILKEFRNR